MELKNTSKIKLLKIYEFLRLETDEEHPISRTQLCEKLNAMGLHAEPRTLTTDIDALNAFGFEVMVEYVQHEKWYYVTDRDFSVPEIKVLIDAVQAANFITPKKTEELIDKIASLAGSRKADVLKSNLVHFNTTKHSNESVYYSIETIEEALQRKKKVSFFYFDVDENRTRVYRKDKWRYKVSPIALIYVDDQYYLMTYHSKKDATVNYRVDRMDQVRMEDEPAVNAALEYLETVPDYTKAVFSMYHGETVPVTLEFEDGLMRSVYDKFGEEVGIRRTGPDTCETTVEVQVSPPFFGWVFQFGDRMRILAPEDVARLFEEMKATGRKE